MEMFDRKAVSQEELAEAKIAVERRAAEVELLSALAVDREKVRKSVAVKLAKLDVEAAKLDLERIKKSGAKGPDAEAAFRQAMQKLSEAQKALKAAQEKDK